MSGWLAAMKKDAPEAKPEDAPAIGGADVTKVVVDTNAIVKGFRLERFADEAVTIPEVLQEVRDKQARHTLATLPFELKVRDPDEASLKAVRRFARLTGDLGALSEPDLRVIALAYMLERDAHGVAHLREDPPPLVLSKHKHNKASKMPGWDFVHNDDDWAELDELNLEAERAAAAVTARMASATMAEPEEAPAPLPKTALVALDMRKRLERKREKARENEDQDDVPPVDDAPDAEDDDEGGWEQNVSRTTRVRRKKREQRRLEAEAAAKAEAEADAKKAADETRASRGDDGDGDEDAAARDAERAAELEARAKDAAAFFESAPGEVPDDDAADDESDDETVPFESTVTSVTADYAMQNVILQMNLRLLTPDGMRITSLRRWVLRCHACGEVTRQTTRVFCPKCGNSTLQKVEHTVGSEGVEQFGVRRKHVLRGTRFSLPQPKGGRREKAPILREDQLIGMRSAKRREDEDVFAAGYNDESFAGLSRGAQPGTAHLFHQRELMEAGGFPKKNPNERRHVRTNRRRK